LGQHECDPTFPDRLPHSLTELHVLNLHNFGYPVEESFVGPFRHLTRCSKLVLSSVGYEAPVIDLTISKPVQGLSQLQSKPLGLEQPC
jgi:hypothetical protein